MSLRIWVILQSVVIILGILPSFGVQMASVMGGAAAGDRASGQAVALIGFLFPFVLISSLLVLWVCYWFGWRALTLASLAAPWLYLAALGVSMAILFRSAS
jgi:hypothetical protein